MSRRVVVTGVGLISALGLNTEDTWSALVEGKCGIGPITQFDATEFSTRIAAEVHGFDPLTFIDRKELKKMGRFIQFAIAASDEALKASGLQVTPDNAEQVGVYIGSGIGAFEVIEREHRNLLEKGPAVSVRSSSPPPSSTSPRATSPSAVAPRAPIRLLPPPVRPALIALATHSGSSSTATPTR